MTRRPKVRITPREREILAACVTGEKQEAVAARIGISPQTLKNHLSRAYEKLEATSLVDAYRRLGWLRVGGPDPRDDIEAELARMVADLELLAASVKRMVDTGSQTGQPT